VIKNAQAPEPAPARGADHAFARVATAARPFLPHEEAYLALFSPEGRHVLRFVSTTHASLELTGAQELWLLEQPELARFGTGTFPFDASRGWLRAPLRVRDAIAGTLVFFARLPAEYASADLLRAQWVADVVSVLIADGELVDDRSGFERSGDAAFDLSEEVLNEIAHVLDVRPVFPRISAIVNRVLPHDRLTMTFHDPDGLVGLQAESTLDDSPVRVRVSPDVLAQPFVLLPKLTREALVNFPAEARESLLASGFNSFLAVNVRAGEQRLGVEFWSKRLHGFSIDDVPLARRIANYVALAVSHEQLAEGRRQVAETRTRARQLDARLRSVSVELDAKNGGSRIVGESATWKVVLRAATRVADTDATVLLTGESGSGKEVVARFIHAASRRSHGPFIAVDCAALPEQLLESELFGYERGAFTGASGSKPGQIELAAGGVLFLDEVSEMSLSAQAKFLRVLQEREFRRLGGTRLLKADVRVIAATNSELRHAIEQGQFRRDLYYRLRVFDLRLPSLRERLDDIVPLSNVLLQDIGARLARPIAKLTPAARAALVAYDWPGNVRELRNVLERAAILSENGVIDAGDLSFDADVIASNPTTNLDEVERRLIEKVLRECHGNKSRAAKRLGLTRMQLYVRLRRYQVDGHAAN